MTKTGNYTTGSKEYLRQYRIKNKEKWNEYQRQYHKIYYQKNKEKLYPLIKGYQRRYRPELILLLGNKCTNCNIDDIRVLEFCHINNDGKEDRKRFCGSNNTMMHGYYIKHVEEARKNLKLLCANCHILNDLYNRQK